MKHEIIEKGSLVRIRWASKDDPVLYKHCKSRTPMIYIGPMGGGRSTFSTLIIPEVGITNVKHCDITAFN